MSVDFRTTPLWQRTLGDQVSDSTALRNSKGVLRAVLLGLRENVEHLVNRIEADLPEYTVHNISHLDALWNTASLVIGDDYPVTPLEAFLFGGAALLHDAGLSVAAYPNGISDVRSDRYWLPTLIQEYRSMGVDAPSDVDIADPPVTLVDRVVGTLLRERHAEHAEALATLSWDAGAGTTPRFLLEHVDARLDFGEDIGALAHSHWMDADELLERLDRTRNAPAWAPSAGSADLLVIALMIRTADAIHLDQGRAPRFKRALLKPTATSTAHWDFQERLDTPRRSGDSIVFSSAPFPSEKASAWWMCFDSLRVADQELRHAHAVLADTKRPLFAVSRVHGCESPRRLAQTIPPAGWEPLDTQITVTDVGLLARKLGGEKLYGDQPWVVLRELIQNGVDATNAARAMGYLGEDEGRVTVSTHVRANSLTIAVKDEGIGMTRHALQQYLLRFAESYWHSPLMRKELPSLAGTGFRSIGRHGIGFFSVFMLGTDVKVITRSYMATEEQTLVLEFTAGLTARPVLRRARRDECIKRHGTSVQFDAQEHYRDGNRLFSRVDEMHCDSPEIFLARLCPALEVDLFYEDENGRRQVIAGGDWRTMSGAALCERLRVKPSDQTEDYRSRSLDLVTHLRDLKREERIIARAFLHHDHRAMGDNHTIAGVVTEGGLYAGTLMHVSGIFSGGTDGLRRDDGVPIATAAELAPWANEQAILLADRYHDVPIFQSVFATVVLRFGAELGSLKIGETAEGWLDLGGIQRWAAARHEIIAVQDAAFSIIVNELVSNETVRLEPNVLLIPMGGGPIILSSRQGCNWPLDLHGQEPRIVQDRRSVERAVIEAIQRAWDVTNPVPEREIQDQVTVAFIGTTEIRNFGYRLRRELTGEGN